LATIAVMRMIYSIVVAEVFLFHLSALDPLCGQGDSAAVVVLC
jgi:hypothetical protein